MKSKRDVFTNIGTYVSHKGDKVVIYHKDTLLANSKKKYAKWVAYECDANEPFVSVLEEELNKERASDDEYQSSIAFSMDDYSYDKQSTAIQSDAVKYVETNEANDIDKYLNVLTESQKRVVIAKMENPDASDREIARILSINHSAVGKILASAKQRILKNFPNFGVQN